MQPSDLKPCPFCGDNDVATYGLSDGGVTVRCECCGANGPRADYDDFAIEAWNRRAPLSAQDGAVGVKVECPACRGNGVQENAVCPCEQCAGTGTITSPSPAQEANAGGEPVGLKIHGLSLENARNLVEQYGGDETDMTVEFIRDGHSGSGFYCWCTEYPEDGSTYLGPASEHSYLSALASSPSPEGKMKIGSAGIEKADIECLDCGYRQKVPEEAGRRALQEERG